MALTISPIIPSQQIQSFTINTNQAAATYTLCTASADLMIHQVQFYTATAAGGITSVSCQTNDTTPFVLLSAVDGAVAALTGGKNIITTWTQVTGFILKSGKLIQYTIVGVGNAGAITTIIRYSSPTGGSLS